MSDTPEPPSSGPHALARAREQIPGCGFAVYTLLLLCIAGAGVVGMTVAFSSLVATGETGSPFRLSYGGLVDPAFLTPLRTSGVLGPEDVPEAFHAETIDGSSACALVGSALVRIEAGVVTKVAIAEVTTVELRPDGVATAGPVTIFCPFAAGEGADRFARMIEAGRRR